MDRSYGSQREPTESSDPMFEEETSTRSAERGKEDEEKVQEMEVPQRSQAVEQETNFENLRDRIHEVNLEDRDVFPPGDFVGSSEGTSVDHPIGQVHDTPPTLPPSEESVIGQSTDTPMTHPPTESSPPKPKLRRKSSSLAVKTVTLPKLNCPEKIFLCVDHSAELFRNEFRTQSAEQTSAFRTLTNAIKKFVCIKSFLNRKHEFSLIMMNEDAQLITDFTTSYEEILYMLNDIAEASPDEVDDDDENMTQQNKSTFDLSDLFNVIKQQAVLPRVNMKQAAKIPPPYVVRVIVIYGRSDCHPRFVSGQKNFVLLNNSPYFFVDAVYIHDTPDMGGDMENKKMVEIMEIFSEICSLDARGSSHIHEVGTDSNIASLYNIFAKLLAHPLQRPKQGETSINYNLEQE